MYIHLYICTCIYVCIVGCCHAATHMDATPRTNMYHVCKGSLICEGGGSRVSALREKHHPHPLVPFVTGQSLVLTVSYRGTSHIRNRTPAGPYSSICLGHMIFPGGGGGFL